MNMVVECYHFNHLKMIEISEKRYKELLQSEKQLSALEEAGVDNWDGYEIAMEEIE